MRKISDKIVAIVIPTHKGKISKYERIALKRVINIFGNFHDIFIFVSSNNINSNLNISSCLKFIEFDPKFFGKIERYNKLMLSKKFYHQFNNYDYILIMHLDALIFRNDLIDWCNKGYDYIGSPWINSTDYYRKYIRKIMIKLNLTRYFELLYCRMFRIKRNLIGNGGLTLRNVNKCLSVINKFPQISNNWPFNEDQFWSFVAPYIVPDFKVSPFQVGLDFSFETKPDYCYRKNNLELPFGCHAWQKHNIEFWKLIFKKYKYFDL